MVLWVEKRELLSLQPGVVSSCMSRDIYAPIPSRIIVDSEMVQAIKIFAESLRKVCGLRGGVLSVSFVSGRVRMSRKNSRFDLIRRCVG